MIRVAIFWLILVMPATAQNRPPEPVDPCTVIAQDDLRQSARALSVPKNEQTERELAKELRRLAHSKNLATMLRCLMNTRSKRNSLGRTE